MLLILSSCNYEKTLVSLGSEFDSTWNFNSGSDYDFDENLVEVKNGKAQLKALDLEHSGTDFNSGTHVGSSLISDKILIKSKVSNQDTDVNTILPSDASSLVGYWRFEGNLSDQSTYNNNGTHNNGSLLTSEYKLGEQGAQFDGIASYINFGSDSSLELGTADITISLWIKAQDPTESFAVLASNGSRNNTEPGYWLSINGTTGNLELWVADGVSYVVNGFSSSTDLRDNKWHHIVWVWDRDVGNAFYIDGSLTATESTTLSAPISAFTPNTIGGSVNAVNDGFLGTMDEVAIWRTALSAEKVQSLYEKQNANHSELSPNWTPKWDNIVGYWKMDGNWQDSSGNGNHGVANDNASFISPSKVGSQSGAFDGNGDFVTASAGLGTSIQSNTIMAWVKSLGTSISTGSTGIFGIVPAGGGGLPQNMIDSTSNMQNDFRCFTSFNTGNLTPIYSGVVHGVWYHLACVMNYTGGTVTYKMYINGDLFETRSIVASSYSSTGTNYSIGKQKIPTDRYFNGNIDEAVHWLTDLSNIEIKNIYNRQKQKYASHYDSEVIYLGSATSNWPDLSWSTILPFGKEIVGDFDNDGNPDSESSSDYSAMSGNLSNGLVGYWPLNEPTWTGAVTEVKDLSGKDGHGQSFGTIQSKTGKLHRGADFSDLVGGGDYIDIPNSLELENVQENNYTLSAWYRPSIVPSGTGADHDLIQSVLIKQGRHLGIVYTSNRNFSCLHWQAGNDVSQGSASQFEIGNFYHIVCRVNVSNGTVEIFVNGVFEGQSPALPLVRLTSMEARAGESVLPPAELFSMDGLLLELLMKLQSGIAI